MRAALALAVVLGACVVDDSTTLPEDPGSAPAQLDLAVVAQVEQAPEVEPAEDADLCGLAAGLPASDVCSLICDPDAFATRLVDSGMHGGSCYQFRCDLGAGTVVSVGMCLP